MNVMGCWVDFWWFRRPDPVTLSVSPRFSIAAFRSEVFSSARDWTGSAFDSSELGWEEVTCILPGADPLHERPVPARTSAIAVSTMILRGRRALRRAWTGQGQSQPA